MFLHTQAQSSVSISVTRSIKITSTQLTRMGLRVCLNTVCELLTLSHLRSVSTPAIYRFAQGDGTERTLNII